MVQLSYSITITINHDSYNHGYCYYCYYCYYCLLKGDNLVRCWKQVFDQFEFVLQTVTIKVCCCCFNATVCFVKQV